MDNQETVLRIWDFFRMGGWAMWPLLIFSTATIALIVERVISIFVLRRLGMRKIHDKILSFLGTKNLSGAREYCESCDNKSIGADIMLAGLNMASLGEHRMEKAIEAEAAEKINELERGFNLLIALGSLAPITGFLGTVSGMISAFRSIANAADVNAQLVANGIFEALITTAFGLSIAIIAIAGYNLFYFFVDKFTADVEQCGSDVITSVLLMKNES